MNVCGEHCQKKGIEKDFKGKGNKDRLMEEHVITISDNEGERGEGEGEQGQANGGAHDNNLRQRGCE